MNIEDLRGTAYVLYASDAERAAIKVVNLFAELALLVAESVGESKIELDLRKLHQHFPHFASKLGLSAFGPDGRSNVYGNDGEHGACQAILAHERACRDDKGSPRVSIVVNCRRDFDLRAVIEETMWMVGDLGLTNIGLEDLLAAARETLKLMGHQIESGSKSAIH